MAAMRRTMRSLQPKTSLFRALSSTNPPPSSFIVRSFHSDDIFGNNNSKSDNNSNNNPFESADDFERRLFGPDSKSGGDGPIADSFYRKLDRFERAHGRSSGGGFGPGSWRSDRGGGMVEGFDTLSDGLDDKLKRAATTFQVGDGMMDDDYSFRPDVTFIPGTTYTPRDLDLTKPGIQKSYKRPEFETTTAEVLKKADFRNVRFLANFLTEAGIIIKRRQTKISAKAQRKVAREIKTARAFGLMPFTTMGTKPFAVGRSMEDTEEDYKYDDDDYNRTPNAAAVEPDEEI